MKITIKTLSGETFPIEIDQQETILSIKQKIQTVKNFDTLSQKLLRKGALLQDEKTAEELGIQDGDFLVVMVNVKKQPPTQPPQQIQPPSQSQQQQPQSQQAPQIQTQTQQALGTGLIGDSSLAQGPEYENAVNEMASMGFSKEQAQAAMKAAYNNPERAIDYLLNGIPTTTSYHGSSQSPVESSGSEQGGMDNATAGLMQSPQFQQLRLLAQQNPQAFAQMMPQLMQTISQQNPQLYQANPEQFMAALFGDGGQQQGGSNQVQVNLTEAEKVSVDNMTQFGFNKNDALEAFLVCDRNEEMALNYLLEKQANGDLLSQHIEREQNDPQYHPGPEEGEDEEEEDDDIYH